MAGISANNDATDKGDLVYTHSLTSIYQPVNIQANEKNNFSFTVFPNPVNDLLKVNLNNPNHEQLSFQLYDLQRKLISDLKNIEIKNNGGTMEFQMSNFNSGIYFLKVKSATFSQTKKNILDQLIS